MAFTKASATTLGEDQSTESVKSLQDETGQQQLEPKEREPSLEAATGVPAVKEEYPTGRRLIPILVAVLCAIFLVSLDMTIIGR
jgi:hypothetical protein